MAMSAKRRVYTIILVLLVTCLVSAVMLFRFLPQQPFFGFRARDGTRDDTAEGSTKRLAASVRSGSAEGDANTRGGGGPSASKSNAVQLAQSPTGKRQRRDTDSNNNRPKRNVAVSVVIPVSTTIARWQKEDSKKKVEDKKEKGKDKGKESGETQDKKKLVKEKLSMASFHGFLVQLEPLLGHPYNATGAVVPRKADVAVGHRSSAGSALPAAVAAGGGATEVLLVVHVTSVESDKFATDLEKLLTDNPFIRVIRVFRKNATLPDGKVSVRLLDRFSLPLLPLSLSSHLLLPSLPPLSRSSHQF